MGMKEFTILDHLLKVAPLINQFTQADLGVAICDREKWLTYIPAQSLDLKIKAGDPVYEGTAAYKAMKNKKRVVVEVDASLYGVPYIAVGLPLFDERGEVIGAIGVSENTHRKELLLDLAKRLGEDLQRFQSTIQQIAAEAQELSATSQELKNVTEIAAGKIEATESILSTVKQIAKQTNLIGLNASIEAARVGEYGRGFNVVANEVRNLSHVTGTATNEISTIINWIREAIRSIDTATRTVSHVSHEQAEKLIQINPILEDFNKMVQDLIEAAESLTKDYLQGN